MKIWLIWPGRSSTRGQRAVVAVNGDAVAPPRLEEPQADLEPFVQVDRLRRRLAEPRERAQVLDDAAVRSAPRAMMSRISPARRARAPDVVGARRERRRFASRPRSGATLVTMKLTGLLISCATPATSRPSDAIFSVCTSCDCAACSSA